MFTVRARYTRPGVCVTRSLAGLVTSRRGPSRSLWARFDPRSTSVLRLHPSDLGTLAAANQDTCGAQRPLAAGRKRISGSVLICRGRAGARGCARVRVGASWEHGVLDRTGPARPRRRPDGINGSGARGVATSGHSRSCRAVMKILLSAVLCLCLASAWAHQ